jgi:hypothetical protein
MAFASIEEALLDIQEGKKVIIVTMRTGAKAISWSPQKRSHPKR